MATTKLQIVQKAFAEIGLPVWTYSIAPEQLVDAGERMDAMVAEWATVGVRIAYNFSNNLDDAAGLSLGNQLAVITNLALQLAPGLGKTPSEQTLATAASTLATLMIAAAQPPQVQLPANMPRGAGAKAYRYSPYQTFVPPPDAPPLTVSGNGTQLDFKQE